MATDPSFVIVEWTAEISSAEMPEAPLHLHRECDEAWYVLSGTLKVKSGDEILTVSAGEQAFITRGTPHTYWNGGPEPARYLLIMTPLTQRLIDAIHQTDDRSLPNLKAIFQAHNSELLM